MKYVRQFKNYLKNGILEYKTKTKGMNINEKAEFTWEYYKGIFIVTAFLLFIGGVTVYDLANPAPSPITEIAFFGHAQNPDAITELKEDIEIEMKLPEENKTIHINSYFDFEDPELSIATSQKFTAAVYVGSLNIIIASKEETFALYDVGVIKGFDSFFEPTQMDEFEKSLDFLKNSDTGEEVIFGISLEGAAYLEQFGIYTDGMYLSIVVGSEIEGELLSLVRLLCS